MAARRWCFTCFDLEVNPFDWEGETIRFCIWQKEKCPESGKEHLQGYVAFTKPMRISALQKICKTSWIKCKGSEDDNVAYCSKEQSRVEGPWQFGNRQEPGQRTDIHTLVKELKAGRKYEEMCEEHALYYDERYARIAKRVRDMDSAKEANIQFEDRYKSNPLREWQKEIVEMLENQPERQVLWIVDFEGNTGKSFLAQYLEVVRDYQVLSGGKHADIAFALRTDARGYAFDFSRDEGEDKTPYKILERIKDRFVPSPKYESQVKKLVSSRVICFANFGPDKQKMSLDRWKVIEVVKRNGQFVNKELDGYNE